MTCVECLTPVSESALVIRGGSGGQLCQQCVDLYYMRCAKCERLIPSDETLTREGACYCLDCHSNPDRDEPAEALSTEELAALISDFIRLHAEEKKVKEQLEEIKGRLKRHAASQSRVNNAVLLRDGEQAVKCGYSSRVSYDSEKLAIAENLLGAEKFAELFSREVKFTPIKDRLADFLAGQEETLSTVRTTILAAMEHKEVVTIAPANPKVKLRS